MHAQAHEAAESIEDEAPRNPSPAGPDQGHRGAPEPDPDHPDSADD